MTSYHDWDFAFVERLVLGNNLISLSDLVKSNPKIVDKICSLILDRINQYFFISFFLGSLPQSLVLKVLSVIPEEKLNSVDARIVAYVTDLKNDRYLQEGRIDIHDKGEGGSTLVSFAMKIGKTDAVSTLISLGAEQDVKLVRPLVGPPESEHLERSTSLHYAAAQGHVRCFQPLYRLAATLQGRDESGGTALHTAAEYGQTESVLALHQQGAYIHEVDDKGQTPLHRATKQNQKNAALLLIELGASPYLLDTAKKSALSYCAPDLEQAISEAYSSRLKSVREGKRRYLTLTVKIKNPHTQF